MALPDLKLLQTAIVLLEVRNYSRAAKQLGIQQPALTKRVRELEEFIGFKLFLRTTQVVEPTDACRELVRESRAAVFHAERAVQVAKAIEQGAQTVLQVGKSQYLDPYLASLISSVNLPLYPNSRVLFTNLPYAQLEQEILLGRLDVAIISGRSDNAAITQLELARSPFYILMSDRLDLASHFELTLDLLSGYRWTLFDRHLNPRLYDAVMQAATLQGAIPTTIQHAATAEEAAQVIYNESSDVAFLTRAGAWRVARSGLTMRPLAEDTLAIVSMLIAREDNESRIVSEFTRALKRKLDTPRGAQLDLPWQKNAIFKAS